MLCSLDRIAPALAAARTSTSEPASRPRRRRGERDQLDHGESVGVSPHVLVNERPGSSRITASPRAERVRRAGHRLDGEAAPVDVRQRVAGEEHHVPVGLVQPERQPGAVGGAELDAGEAVVALEVGEAVVEPRRADRPRLG